MKTRYFQFRLNLILVSIVMIASSFLELLNYAINPSMIGFWNPKIFFRDALITEIFFIVGMIVLSKRILVNVHVTSLQLCFFLFGKEFHSIKWDDVSSILFSKQLFSKKLIIKTINANISTEIDITKKQLLVFHELCSNQSVCDEIKKYLDIWSSI